MQRLLTAKDLQEIFSVGKNQAYALMKSSGFPSIEINRRYYVSEEELQKWIKEYSGRKYIF